MINTMDLFSTDQIAQEIQTDIFLLRNYANDALLLSTLSDILDQAPPRHMQTPGGRTINAAMTACGTVGWISDHKGYRYSHLNPHTQQPWPAMPTVIQQLAERAAAQCRFDAFAPDSCLINHYQNGQGMGCHRDEDEHNNQAPVVSISLGMTATFQIFGLSRSGIPLPIDLYHGDVMVWGRSARLMYHAVKPMRANPHPQLGPNRYNLTVRKAL